MATGPLPPAKYSANRLIDLEIKRLLELKTLIMQHGDVGNHIFALKISPGKCFSPRMTMLFQELVDEFQIKYESPLGGYIARLTGILSKEKSPID